MYRVFVYGTLKRGFRNHKYLESATFIGMAHTVSAYRMLDGTFPVLLDKGADRRTVSGEMYDVDDHTLARLDDLEDIASGMYQRIETDVVLTGQGADKIGKAFIYIGGSEYWDKKNKSLYLGTDRFGHLDWLAPDKRPR